MGMVIGVLLPFLPLIRPKRATCWASCLAQGQAGPTRRVNARMTDDKVRKLTPQWGLW